MQERISDNRTFGLRKGVGCELALMTHNHTRVGARRNLEKISWAKALRTEVSVYVAVTRWGHAVWLAKLQHVKRYSAVVRHPEDSTLSAAGSASRSCWSASPSVRLLQRSS